MEESVRIEFEAIGTKWVIDLYGKKTADIHGLRKKIDEEIKNFSDIFSRFDEKSQIYLASKSARKIKIPSEYLNLIKTYKKLYHLTNGFFTPLVGNLLIEAGYDKDYSLNPKQLNPVLPWEDVIDFESSVLEIKKPWMLDFGAGGKGFLVDLIGKILEESGINSYCIDGSGDILFRTLREEEDTAWHKPAIDSFKTLGEEKIKVGLEHPENKSQVIGVAEIKNRSICASAGNRRKWGNFHHIFNPHSLKSEDKVLATWVIADAALIADALATCLFFTNPEKLATDFKFEFIILYPDLTFKKSTHFPGEIYTTCK